MHWSGKTFAILAVLAALFCVPLTSKFIAVRNSWARKAQKFEATYNEKSGKLAETRRQAEQLQNDLSTTNREWGFTWFTNTSVSSPDGKLAVDLGTNNRIRDKQILYGFEPTQDGRSIYRGAFVVLTAQADRSALAPTWRARPQEVQSWSQQGQWRWRSEIPSAYSKGSDDQARLLTTLDETNNDRRSTLDLQEKLIREAQAQRKHRIAELIGGEDLAQDASLAPEFRQGLSITLASLEEERNKVLLEIDALRRKVRQTRDAVEQLQTQNEQLVQKLPQPAPVVSRRD